jgi:hypothetical protein
MKSRFRMSENKDGKELRIKKEEDFPAKICSNFF